MNHPDPEDREEKGPCPYDVVGVICAIVLVLLAFVFVTSTAPGGI